MGRGDFAEDPLERTKISVTEAVMDQRPSHRAVARTGNAGNDHDRHVFGIGTGDTSSGAQIADPGSDDERGCAFDPSVPICGIGSVEFVAIPNPGRPGAVGDRANKFKNIITRDTEDGVDAEFPEPVQKIIRYCELRQRISAFLSAAVLDDIR